MSTKDNKGQSYINVSADIQFLQRVICCNHDMNKTNKADTPRGSSPPTTSMIELKKEENIDIEEDE